MKNIQVIDGADNCTYSIFSTTEEIFNIIFPLSDQDVEFNTDLMERISDEERSLINTMWDQEVKKSSVVGIHGTLFFDLDFKKKYYPTKKEKEMVVDLTPRENTDQ